MKVSHLFPTQPKVTYADRKRLLPHLSGWNRICSLMESELTTEDDIKRLVVLEFDTKQRVPILQKLLACQHAMQRRRILNALTPRARTTS